MKHDIKFQDFAADIYSEVNQKALGLDNNQPDYKPNAFTEIATTHLAELGALDDTDLCYCNKKTPKGSIKANAYGFSDGYYFLNLVTTVFFGDYEVKLNLSEARQAIARANRLVEMAKSGYHKKMEPSSPEYAMLSTIHKHRNKIQRVRVFLVTDGTVPQSVTAELATDDHAFQIWDLTRFYRCFGSKLPYEAIRINFAEDFNSLPCLPLNHPNLKYQTYLTIIPGTVLASLYDAYGSQLLELNVRSFLQARGKVNKGIRDTLKGDPGSFLAYNNGICATAESIETAQGEDGSPVITALSGFQVVNGGQTMASIHRAGQVDKTPLDDVFVQAKITLIEPELVDTIVPLISRYANSQNKVNDADLTANDPFHIVIERLSGSTWAPGEQSRWFYERARGQHQVIKAKYAITSARKKEFDKTFPTSQKFTKTDLARFLNCWHMRPDLVSKGNQKNFVEFMGHLHNNHPKDWEPDQTYYKDLIAKAIVYKRMQKIVRIKKDEIEAYRVNVVNYTVSYLVARTEGKIDLDMIWDNQAISDELVGYLSDWSVPIYHEIIRTAAKANVTEWCKKKQCWEKIAKMELDLPTDAPEYDPSLVCFSTQGARREMTQEDEENTVRVMKVDSDVWADIFERSKAEGKLNQGQRNIVSSMRELAEDGWEKPPSAKQVNQAVMILDAFEL